MKSLLDKIKVFLFYPHSKVVKEIKDIHHHMKGLSDSNNRRAGQLMATLNGEDGWMFKKGNPTEDKCDGISK